jgi:Family of unknown function (DUF5362)
MDQNPSTNLFDLNVDQQSADYLGETAKWAKFFAILGFIGCGLMLLFALFAGAVMTALRSSSGQSEQLSTVATVIISICFILFGLLYFFPCLYLYNFAAKMQVALRNNDQPLLTQSFKNLKSCFRFIGILTIITLSLYAIFFMISLLTIGSRV